MTARSGPKRAEIQHAPAPRDETLSKARLRLWLKLLKASGIMGDALRRQLRGEFGATLPRFDVMSALSRSPEGLKMSQISEMLRVSNGNVTGIVDKLAEEGLALRVAVPGDRRAARVRLTPKGVESFKAQAKAHEHWVNEMLGGLGDEDLRELTERLANLVDSLERDGHR